jgi:hypothetical protein
MNCCDADRKASEMLAVHQRVSEGRSANNPEPKRFKSASNSF